MRWPRFEGRRRWLAPAALLIFVPKCGLCLLGYAGLGALLGLGGPELCTAGDSSSPWSGWALGGLAGVAVLTLAVRAALRHRARP